MEVSPPSSNPSDPPSNPSSLIFKPPPRKPIPRSRRTLNNAGNYNFLEICTKSLRHRKPPKILLTSYSEVLETAANPNSEIQAWIWNFTEELPLQNVTMGNRISFMEILSTGLTVTSEKIEEIFRPEDQTTAKQRLEELQRFNLLVEWTSLCPWSIRPNNKCGLCSEVGCICDVKGWYIMKK